MTLAAVLVFALSLSIAAPPSAAVDAYKEGTRLAKTKDSAGAIAALEKAVKIDPSYSEAWSELGNTHLTGGSIDEAIRAFAQAVKHRPDFQVARYNLAYALKKKGNFPKAAEHYRIYLQRDPDDADAWFGLAESLRQGGESAAAAEAYEAYVAREKRPKQAKWVKKAEEQAKALRKASGTTAGVAAPVKAQKEATKDAAGTKHVSFSAKTKRGGEATATEDAATETAPAQKAVEAKPAAKRPETFEAGLGYLKTGDYETALVRLESAAKSAPEDAFVLAALGSAHLGLRNGKEAEVAYRRALATAKPEAVPGIWLGIGESMRILGEPAQALEAFDRIAKDESASPAVKAAAKERADALR